MIHVEDDFLDMSNSYFLGGYERNVMLIGGCKITSCWKAKQSEMAGKRIISGLW